MRYIGYIDRIYSVKTTVTERGRKTYRTFRFLTNEGEYLVVVYNSDLINRIGKLQPGTAVVVFPSGKRDNVLFVNRLGRIIIANEEHKKELLPYEELKKKTTFYNFKTVKDVIEGEEGTYTIIGDLYNVSRVYPVTKKDKKFVVIRAGLEDFTGSIWTTIFDTTTLLGIAGTTEEEIFRMFNEKLENVDIKNEDEYREKKKEAQIKLAELFKPILGRTFIATIRKRKREENNDYDYIVTKIEVPTPETIIALKRSIEEVRA